MFGRKKKQEEDPLGLSSIGSTASVMPAGPPTPADPADPAPAQQPAAQTFVTPGGTLQITSSQGTPMVFGGGMQFGTRDMLKQVLGASGPIHDLVQEIQADPMAFRNKMMAQMQAAGVSTFVMTP